MPKENLKCNGREENPADPLMKSPAARWKTRGRYNRGVVPCGTGAKTCADLQYTTQVDAVQIQECNLGFGIVFDADADVTNRPSLLLLLTNAGHFSRGVSTNGVNV